MKTAELQKLFLRIRSNKTFELSVVAIIIFSALVIGAKTYDISPTMLRVIHYLDNAITLIFLVEILIRFIGEENKRRFFNNGWNVFDTVIVVVSLIPIQDSEMAFIGRLVRIFRVLRMISIVPELRVLLNSLFKALPQLGYVVLLMFIIFYIYGALGAIMFAKINETLWGDISIAMLTLFRVMTFEDWTDVMYETMAVYPYSWIYYLTFIFFTAFAFLNMVIGIVVNVIEDEHTEMRKVQSNEPSLSELQKELREIKELLSRLQK
jgi:voltage-gated sodium channel